MKRFIAIAAIVLFAPTMAHAQALYTDLNAGIGFMPEVVIDIDYDDGVDMLSGEISGQAESSLTFGGEVGFRGVGSKHLSFGVSVDYFEVNAESVRGSFTGVIDDMPFDIEGVGDSDNVTWSGMWDGMPVDGTFPLDPYIIDSFDLDDEVVALTGNLRYDFVGPKERLQPYIGVGGGVSFISDWDSVTTLSATFGVKLKMTNSFYTGVRYRYLRMFDVTDIDLGDHAAFTRRDSDVHLITLTFGASPYYGQ